MALNIHSVDYWCNPYPSFKKLRTETPVSRIAPHGHWVVSRYADVQMILKNPDIFSSSGITNEPASDNPEFLLLSRGLIGTDRPDHTRLRRLISKAFTPMIIRRLEPRIRLLCKSLIQPMRNRSTVDFIREFATPLPIIVIAELMGLDPEKMNTFKRWAELLITWRNQMQTNEVLHEVEQMFQYFTHLIEERRQIPKADLISALVTACEHDHVITGAEIIGFIRLLLVAGTDTTTNLLGNAALALLSHPDQLEHVQQHTAIIPDFIEESLRYDSPSLSLSRRVTENVEVADATLCKGDIVLPLLASANHDEAMFTNPDIFDISRNTQGHMAFGAGIHHCIGSQLTRLQARIAFEEIFNVFQHFKRADEQPLEYINSFFFRGIRQLRLIFR